MQFAYFGEVQNHASSFERGCWGPVYRWAALGRDPQEDTLEYTCPYCGERGVKAARRTPDQYHFTDGFLQDLQGEMAACHSCRHSLRIAPVVLLHDQDEKRRFEGVFSDDLVPSKN